MSAATTTVAATSDEAGQRSGRTVTLDGTTYDADRFSQEVQSALAALSAWEAQHAHQQLEAMKTHAAIEQLSRQVAEAMKAELDEERGPQP